MLSWSSYKCSVFFIETIQTKWYVGFSNTVYQTLRVIQQNKFHWSRGRFHKDLKLILTTNQSLLLSKERCHNVNHYGDTDNLSCDEIYCFVKSAPSQEFHLWEGKTIFILPTSSPALFHWENRRSLVETFEGAPRTRPGPNFIELLSKQICLAWNFFLDENSITNQLFICCILLVTGIQLLFANILKSMWKFGW